MARISFNVMTEDSEFAVKMNVEDHIGLGRVSAKSVAPSVVNVRITCRKDQLDTILDGGLRSVECLYSLDSFIIWS